MDITATYKYPDNSPTERIIQTKIRMRRKQYRNISPSPVSIIISPPACVSFTSDCYIYFTLNNASRTNCKVKFRLTIVSVNYKGTVLQTLMEELYETQLAGNGGID
ncbi:hypothetical protein RF11_10602 [Thelohanellus kitauei]|uniref:Uncharacterized protein n=1 Tax=Thelohanellus kitauei TaxID=669202 RepID=A0A0C2N9U8_THEKT|nr:hypothetical protein RF11_10602 [Thelohanellus kitauei]